MTSPSNSSHLDSTQRVLAAAAVTGIALTALAYLAGLAPMLRASAAKTAQVELVSQTRSDADTLATELAQKIKTAEGLTGDLARIPVKLERATQLNTRLQTLIEVLANAGLVIESQQQDPPVDRKRFGTVAMRFRARGTYLQCIAVVQTLRDRFKDQGIESLELSGNPAEPDLQVTMSLGLVWYVAPPEPKR